MKLVHCRLVSGPSNAPASAVVRCAASIITGATLVFADTGHAAPTDSAPVPPSKITKNAASAEHWSFQPIPKAVPVPPSAPIPLNGNEVDAFVVDLLRQKGLPMSPPADRRTLVRRLYFDLTGLPPSPDEINNFLTDPSPHAWQSLVDRLLASPRYGERWGRHWLDVARYTESQGFEYDRLRDNAWHYRDYVIRAFNDDLPYDRFMKEQVAGDVLEPVTTDGIVAASLLVCGPYDEAGNAQANATQRAITREEELEDTVSAVGQTFLGLTVNCARCHSHKFDPIPQQDYYRLKSVFEGVKHGDRPIISAAEGRNRDERIKSLRAGIAAANAEAASLEMAAAGRVVSSRTGQSPIQVPIAAQRWSFNQPNPLLPGSELKGGASITNGALQLPNAGAFLQSAPLPKDIRERTLEAWVSLADLNQRGGAAISIETDDGSRFDAIVYGERQPRKWMAGSGGFERTQDLDAPEESAAPGEWIHLAAVYRPDNSIALYRNGVPYGQSYTPGSPLQTYSAGRAHVVLGLRHKGGGSPWLTGAIRQAAIHDRALGPEEISNLFRAGSSLPSREESIAAFTPVERRQHEANLNRARELQRELDAVPPVPVSYVGTRVQPKPTVRLRRGDVKSPEEAVTPAALSALRGPNPEFGLAADSPEAGRRLRFAEWLADPRNPLPARVMVNRVWQFHFGQGLVGTPNDFGISGARPTNPQLLDWLSRRFIDGGWSIKTLHRLILLSATYQQSGESNPAAAAVDSDDQLLWRFPPRRLEAEAVRDAMLAASGELNLTMGGPSVRPFEILKFPANAYVPADKIGPEFNRRTVYRMNVNSGKEPLMDSFDCPDPSVKTPRRGVTTTPLQALGLMNNSFVLRQASQLAALSARAASGDLSRAVDVAFQRTLGRPASPDEIRRSAETARQRGLESVCWALLNSTEFVYVR